jgi:hypothetical protein
MSLTMRVVVIVAWILAAAVVVVKLIAAHSYGIAVVALVFLGFVLLWVYGRRGRVGRGGR